MRTLPPHQAHVILSVLWHLACSLRQCGGNGPQGRSKARGAKRKLSGDELPGPNKRQRKPNRRLMPLGEGPQHATRGGAQETIESDSDSDGLGRAGNPRTPASVRRKVRRIAMLSSPGAERFGLLHICGL